MRLSTIRPHPTIAPWIHHFWVFESASGLPEADARVVVPNGRAKLIIPWRNGLSARGAGSLHPSREGEIVVVGVWDQPTTLSSSAAETVTIGIEFNPGGLVHILHDDVDRLYQRIIPIDQVLGRLGDQLLQRIGSADTPQEAVALAHAFLIQSVRDTPPLRHDVVTAALCEMRRAGFTADIGALAGKLGLSRRHLQELFRRQVGLSPKRMQGVLAFEALYRQYARHGDGRRLRDEALDIWFDQAHFIRAFRGFTGHSPGRFTEISNEFGRLFYRMAPASSPGPFDPAATDPAERRPASS